MCSNIRFLITGFVAIMVALATARPQQHDVPQMDLEQVLGHTICPLKVVVDEDPLRLPRRIKYMTCDRNPARLCPMISAGGSASTAACCHRHSHHHDYITQCVEVYDNVVVQFLPWAGADERNATRHVVRVPVGCSCVALTTTPAVEDV